MRGDFGLHQKTVRINATELVPGDLIHLEVGDVIPADIH